MSKVGRGRRTPEQRISDRLARQKAVAAQRLNWDPWNWSRLVKVIRGARAAGRPRGLR